MLSPPWYGNNPDGLDAAQIEAAVQRWNDKMGILEQQLSKTGAFVAGDEFTLADILIGLSVHRWQMTPMARPAYPAIAAYYQRLGQHHGFQLFALDGHN
jgi:Glutathione S-transferase